MRVAQEQKVRFAMQKSQSTSIAAPIGGLNARDSVANMAPTDAEMLENWFPSSTKLSVRNGFQGWNTFTGVCQSILVYNGLTATKVFPCVKNGSTFSIYDGTATGALSSAAVGGAGATVQALTNCRWDYVNFGTAGGQYLFAANGVDGPLRFDGTTWISSLLTGGTPAAYQSFAVFLNRLWTFEKNTFIVHYWGVDVVTGAAAGSALNLGSVFKLGGHLVSIVSITDYGTAGLTDYLAFVSSEGEVVAYTGTDPAAIATWTKAAQFYVGRPVTVGNRNWCKWGADALLLCTDGVYPLRKAIADNRKVDTSAISDKIRPLIAHDISVYGAKYGWQLLLYPKGNKLIVNVPTEEDVSAYQYVMNAQSPAWTKFTGWKAFCFEVAQDTLYMGRNGTMVKADTTAQDGNSAIVARCRQAYNYLGSRGNAKQTKMFRPLITADGDYGLIIGADTDYRPTNPVLVRAVSGGSGDPWGTGTWSSPWRGPAVTSLHWYGVNAIGHAVAPYLAVQVNGTALSWSATDVVFETGGVLA